MLELVRQLQPQDNVAARNAYLVGSRCLRQCSMCMPMAPKLRACEQVVTWTIVLSVVVHGVSSVPLTNALAR